MYAKIQIEVTASNSKKAHDAAWEQLKEDGWSEVDIQSVHFEGSSRRGTVWTVRAGVTL